MEKLLIIADDFTGALDTGIQFAKTGIRTQVVADYSYDPGQADPDCSLLSVSSDSRRTDGRKAWERVYALTRKGLKAGYRNLYKKTDSGLRGNIGMELKAVLDAARTNIIAFVPAFPRMGRTTKGGVQYIDGIPVSESVFGKDPYEPVSCSDLAVLIRQQADLMVCKISTDAHDSIPDSCQEQTVLLFDAETDADLIEIAHALKKKGLGRVCAGCAGFAAVYDEMLSMQTGKTGQIRKTGGLFALCGSVNRITADQMDEAQASGFMRRHLDMERKLMPVEDMRRDSPFFDQLFQEISSTAGFILDTLDKPGEKTAAEYAEEQGIPLCDLRNRIADNLGMIAFMMAERGLDYTFSLTGGDTLFSFMKWTGEKELAPVCEIGNGAVLSTLSFQGRQIQVISKSGGFGEPDIFERMFRAVVK